MGIIGYTVLGAIAGLIAKAINKGPAPGGLIGTIIVGVIGALLGGVIASALGIGSISTFFSIGTWLIAIVGALLFLFIYQLVTSRMGGGAPRPVR